MCSLAPDKITPAGWARDAGVRAALTALATDNQPDQSVLSAARPPGGVLWAHVYELLCMARAMLRDASVLLMDEATASVDGDADKRIQAMIRSSSCFGAATVLTIAHRLDTIMHSDKVLVMDAGRVAEYDSPGALKATPGSIFGGLCAAAEH